jgi:enoyl-CoA hydratase/carnithine racemase
VATREILLLGEPMSARWMADHGVICRVVPENQLNAEAQKIIERLATNAPLSLRAMKALIVRELAFRDGIAHVDIDTMVGATRGSNDAKEGIAARLEKRPPVFTGS